ncbi:MAG: cardiolipin synthetase [Sulfitobacter sp.]|nr:cardiolipin synthetase [Roseobacter sp.]MBV50120.1 cardiolipin synthetase [Roseobacter sp.]MBV50801.1 cardiolipin synthetase [Roseobacter sp.]PHR03780.1 MAG: cardiolipin synthetase [Sulfitobacter sp.]
MISFITTHIEVVGLIFLTLFVAFILLQQRRSPQSTVAWILFLIMLPYVAAPLFLGLGFRKQGNRYEPVLFTTKEEPPTPVHALDATFQHFMMPPALEAQRLTLLDTPQLAFQAALDTIDSAEHSIDVLFYIIANDGTAKHFVQALTDKARKGVHVRLLMDRLGTLRGPHEALKALKAAGGEVLFFSPILQLPGTGHLNLRNHRKMIIADNARAFSGGMNVADHYMTHTPKPGHWVDLAFTLEGLSVQSFCDVFRSDWEVASGTPTPQVVTPAPKTGGNATVQLVPSGPDIAEDPLHDGLIRAIHLAESRIWIATPYFVPTEALANALRIASRRGVDVRIIVPQKSNQRIADFARGGFLRDVQEAGAEIHFFKPSMIHAKAALIDDVGIVGTANFDVRSMLLNFEVMLFLYDAPSVTTLTEWFLERQGDCHNVVRNVTLIRRLAEGVFRIGAPVL